MSFTLRALAALTLSLTPTPDTAAPPPRPTLVVMISVDQLIPDYFDRYGSEFTGGFKRFGTQGIFFTDGRQDHAITETAPGHSTLLSGRAPASTGIVANDLGVLDRASPLIGSSGSGASPWRFRGTGLYDWLLKADSASRVLSVSRKDRAAILPVGRAGKDVYWYSVGRFTTSTWYARALPEWLERWNERRGFAKLTGTDWTLLKPASAYPEPDSMPYEKDGVDNVFPHHISNDTAVALASMSQYPWMDSLTLDVALEGVRAMKLGTRGHTDLLAISLSTVDAVGHAYGPNSREMHDHLLRLDLWLGRFLDSLAVLVPRGETVFALSADHGVQPYPESDGGGRASLTPLVKELSAAYDRRYLTTFSFDGGSGLLSADLSALRARGVDVDSLTRAVARRAATLPGVDRVFTPATLKAASPSDEQARLWRRTIPPDHEWLVAATLVPKWIWADDAGWTNHGTTNVPDMRVPIIFLRPGMPGRRIARRVTTEDIGPTLAALARVQPTERLTGKVLVEVIGPDR